MAFAFIPPYSTDFVYTYKHVLLYSIGDGEADYEDATVEYLEYRMGEGAFTEVMRSLAGRYQRLYIMDQYNILMTGGV